MRLLRRSNSTTAARIALSRISHTIAGTDRGDFSLALRVAVWSSSGGHPRKTGLALARDATPGVRFGSATVDNYGGRMPAVPEHPHLGDARSCSICPARVRRLSHCRCFPPRCKYTNLARQQHEKYSFVTTSEASNYFVPAHPITRMIFMIIPGGEIMLQQVKKLRYYFNNVIVALLPMTNITAR
jgi:hypothetical protein